MNHETSALALLFWHLDATDGELSRLNVTRDDVLNLARSFEAEIHTERRDHLSEHAKSLLLAYRIGQMSPPEPKKTAAA